jgi:DNA polymerase III subunit epsilon
MLLSDAERVISASSDYRLLRRVPPPEQWPLEVNAENLRRGVLVDTETTGLDHGKDEVIELALLPFDYDRDTGRIVHVDTTHALSAFRQPSIPISVESARVHGITNDQVAGHIIDPDQVRATIAGAHLIIAHNARFDRPMVENHWPIFEQTHWACSLADIDWKGEGLSAAKLDYLLMRQGWFHDGHRALSDTLATLFLLTLPLPTSGKPALAALLESARRPVREVRATGASFDRRAALKERGYRWHSGDARRPKAWWTWTSDAKREVDWLIAEVYGGALRDIPVLDVPATMRYSARL